METATGEVVAALYDAIEGGGFGEGVSGCATAYLPRWTFGDSADSLICVQIFTSENRKEKRVSCPKDSYGESTKQHY